MSKPMEQQDIEASDVAQNVAETQIAVTKAEQAPIVTPAELVEIQAQERKFDLTVKIMNAYAAADMLPQAYRGRKGNLFIACKIAEKMDIDPMSVVQNLYVIHGNPQWSGTFAIALFKSKMCGRYSEIVYEDGGKNVEDKDYFCYAWTKNLATGQKLKGPKITWELAKKMGWTGKDGSMWTKDPEWMFRLRAAARLIRLHFPEVLVGLETEGEFVPEERGVAAPGVAQERLDNLVKELKDEKEEAND